ncbi:hypothetical protein J6590_039808 [Homalodisca vitripennis]|nr:hypothetical protein J6590_095624 [Homalodisca vitripennis]KAG8336727.1 hypothetical protein J6590_039808 [Homalodisca vitripennis]
MDVKFAVRHIFLRDFGESLTVKKLKITPHGHNSKRVYYVNIGFKDYLYIRRERDCGAGAPRRATAETCGAAPRWELGAYLQVNGVLPLLNEYRILRGRSRLSWPADLSETCGTTQLTQYTKNKLQAQQHGHDYNKFQNIHNTPLLL